MWEEMALSCCDVTQERKGSVATSQDISSGLSAPFHSPNPCCCAAKAHWDVLNPIPKFLNPGEEELGLISVWVVAGEKVNFHQLTPILAWKAARRIFSQAWYAWNIPCFGNVYSQIYKSFLFWVATTSSSGQAQDLLISRSDLFIYCKILLEFLLQFQLFLRI